MQSTKIAGIYLRISDDREGRELGVSRQREHCLELASRLGCQVYDVYNDNDKGASRYSTKPRKDYQRLLADAKAGRINTIVAYTTGRLTRRPREHEDQIDLAQDQGVQFFYVRSPSFDLNTSAGRRIARILASSDAGEADDISERVSDAKRKQASKGLYLGGYKAYGYEGAKYNDQGELINRGRINIELVPHEVEVYLNAVHRIIAGETPYAVMKDMNQRGIPSPAGKQWTASNFKRQLLKKRYVIFDDDDPEKHGTLEHHGQEYRAAWPGIITRAEYELMLARFSRIKQDWDHGLKHGRTFLLTGFTFCGGCGTVATGARRAVAEGHVRRYRCKPADNSGNPLGCGKVYRLAEPLDTYVTEEVLSRLAVPEIAGALAQDDDKEEMGALVTKLAHVRQRRTELEAEYGRGEHTPRSYKVMVAANDEAVHELEAQIADIQSKHAAANLPALSLIREAWDKATIDWRRNIILLLVERIDILPHGHTGSATWRGWRFNPESVQITWRDIATPEIVSELSLLMQAVQEPSVALAA